MLALAVGSLALVVPHVPPPTPAVVSVVQQRTFLLADAQPEGNVFPGTTMNVATAPQIFKGSADDIDLGSLLDTVPADMKGDAGLEKDIKGVERLRERQAAVEEYAEWKTQMILEREQEQAVQPQ